MTQPYNLVLFDLDGTLLDTIEDLCDAVNCAMDRHGHPRHSLEACRAMVGHGVRNLIWKALPEAFRADDAYVDACLADFKESYSAHIDVHTRPYPGMQELLAALDGAGVKLAVVSNKFQEGTERLIREFFPDIRFAAILGNRPGHPLKPDPAIVEEALGLAGVPVGRAVLVGDSPTDMRTAAAGGIDAVAVAWGYRSANELAGSRIAASVPALQAMLMGKSLKQIEVVAAVILRDGKVFASQRGYGDWKDWWEFPGGKIEAGETPRTALVREIREELDTEIRIDRFFSTVEWDYPAFHLKMHCFFCSLAGEALRLNEHEAARWLSAEEIRSVKWLPADEGLLPGIARELVPEGRAFRVSDLITTAPPVFISDLQQKVYETFAALAIPFERVDTDPGITMEDCQHIDERIGVRIVKTIFLCNRQQTEFWLYVTTDDRPFVTREFCGALGIPRVSFASAERLWALTGVYQGATTILSAVLPEASGVHLVMDRRVAESEWYACTDGTATCFVRIRTRDLLDKYLSGRQLTII